MFVPTPANPTTRDAAAAALRSNLVAKGAVQGSGELQARIEGRDRAFLVRRLVVQGPVGSYCFVFTGEAEDRNLADATINGGADVADYSQPLYVPAGTPLVVMWRAPNGAPAADDGSTYARAEIEDC